MPRTRAPFAHPLLPLTSLLLATVSSAQTIHGYRPERLDDPPGVAAPRPVGAPPAPIVQRASFASVQVNVAAGGANIAGDAANEPSIAVDPTNPDRIAIGWRQFDTTASNFRQAGHAYSSDGGATWTFPGVIEPGVFRSDPVLAAAADGTLYYDSLMSDFTIQVFRSLDGGATWGMKAQAFGGDKAWLAVDDTASPGAGHLYQNWSVFAGCCGNDAFNRSTDGGASFATPVGVPDTPIFGTIAVASDGTVYVGGTSPNDFGVFLVARSDDARNAAATPTFTTASVDLGGSVTLSAGPNPGGLLGQVDVAVDRSGTATDGNVYLLCSVDPPGADPLDVMFSRSEDGGATWSTPVRVNDDSPTSGAWQWFGTMSVAPDGRIDVVWNDTRNSDQPNKSETFYASSIDGGVTWSQNEAVTPQWDSYLGFPNQNKIGDYYDMVSDEHGAYLAFSATFNGEQDVYFLHICTAEAQALAVVRNGGGTNPAGFASVTAPLLGQVWQSTIDLSLPGTQASLLGVGLGGPIAGSLLTGFVKGELLCGPPFLPFDVQSGSHSISLPFDCSLIGATFCAQGATLGTDGIRLDNAIDLTLGTF